MLQFRKLVCSFQRYMETISSREKWGTLISCSLSSFVGFIDFAIVNTALPAIGESLSASMLQLQWVMNAFILMMSVFPATMGRVSDILGRRFINILGVVLFGAASLVGGMATSATLLIICRLFQGIGCAAIIPSSLALITHAFPPEEKGRAFGFWAGITGIGFALGPVLGGILVSTLTWNWIFYINIPFAIASLILNFLFVKESKNTTSEKKIDPIGFILLSVGICSLVVALMHTLDWGWTSSYTLFFFGLSIVSMICFYRSETKCPYPIIPFTAFSNRTFLSSVVVLFCIFFIITPTIFLIPLYLQIVRGEPAYIAGLMLLPITGILAVFSPIVGHLVDKTSSKMLILAGLFFLLISIVLQTFFQADTSVVWVLVSLFFMGFGWTFGRNPASTQGITALPSHLTGAATGVIWTFLNLGGSMGLAIAGTVFRKFYEPTETHAAFIQGYHWAMILLSVVGVFIILFTALRRQNLPN